VPLGLTVVPDRCVGLLGLVPFALGVKGLVAAMRARGDDGPAAPAVATGLASVAAVTVANGVDNISVYTPMFRTIGLTDSLITVAVFTGGVAAWCLAGSWLGSHTKVIEIVRRFGHWIVPGVFMFTGAVIVIASGSSGGDTHREIIWLARCARHGQGRAVTRCRRRPTWISQSGLAFRLASQGRGLGASSVGGDDQVAVAVADVGECGGARQSAAPARGTQQQGGVAEQQAVPEHAMAVLIDPLVGPQEAVKEVGHSVVLAQ
jgi:hypothetical protein